MRLLLGVIVQLFLVGLLNSCLNPFAPAEGKTGSRTWNDQQTIGELLQNFELAYDYRDSLHYSDCLAETFVFHYYDIANGRLDSWYRETDLKTTGGLFRNYNHIDLEWNMIPDTVQNFKLPDITVDFVVRFNLTLGEEAPLMGYAHFSARMDPDNKFRVAGWRDDF
ncbi:MAG: hypothetical protein V2A61_07170 [Calditrichota bacterium]